MSKNKKRPAQSRLRFMSSSPPTAAEVAAGDARWERRGPLQRLARRRCDAQVVRGLAPRAQLARLAAAGTAVDREQIDLAAEQQHAAIARHVG